MAANDATSELSATIATNLRAARKAANLTQHGLAVALGRVDGMAVSRWERAVNRPSDQNLVALATLLGREVAWFYSTHDEPEDVAA